MDHNQPSPPSSTAPVQRIAAPDQEKTNILKRSELFLGLPDEILGRIVGEVTCTVRTCQTNETVFDIGDPARELFIVEEGKVDLVIRHPLPAMRSQIQATIDTVCTGGTFGWSALIAPYTFTLCARCVEPTRVLALDGTELMGFLDRQTAVGYEVMKTLNHIIASRLRDSNRALFNIIASGIKV